jgi:hypothetical protein
MIERTGCIHIHTSLSDGHASHEEVATLAARAGLDYLIVTDHNAYAPAHQGWHAAPGLPGRAPEVLLLVGEEVHDPAHSQESHYLVFGAGEDVATEADSPAQLVAAVAARGGLGFIAHPYEHSGAYSHEDEIDWRDWSVRGYTGLEVWNYMSEFKAHLPNAWQSLLFALWPKLAISGPFPETLARWDALNADGPVMGLGGVDAHATTYSLGPLQRQVFGYAHLFRALRMHLLLEEEWTRDVAHDAGLVYAALAAGRGFLAYDALAPARGFTFTAQQREAAAVCGQSLPAGRGTRFRIQTPAPAHLRLILNGFCVAEERGSDLVYDSRTPGVYRAEAYRRYAGRERGWVFSNPIAVR